MDEEEIVERGLIAYCIICFSVHTVLDIVAMEPIMQVKKETKSNECT